jgi:antitoxin ParD1/3/4
MADIERLTVTMPTEMLTMVKAAVNDGDYASTSEVIREALRDWKMKRALQLQEFVALKEDIQQGLADVSNSRLTEFNADQIIELGRKLLASRSHTA